MTDRGRVVTHAPVALFFGRRIELVLRDGTDVPVVSAFARILGRSHARALDRLRRALAFT